MKSLRLARQFLDEMEKSGQLAWRIGDVTCRQCGQRLPTNPKQRDEHLRACSQTGGEKP